MAADLEKIRAVCDRVAGSLGLEIVEVEFRGGAGKQGRVLRIFIDKPWDGRPEIEALNEVVNKAVNEEVNEAVTREALGDAAADAQSEAQVRGVTLDDCANVSREVSTILDVEDAITGGEYTLEVSSPGLDRKLSREQDYQRFAGSRVKLMTRLPVGVTETSQGNRHFEGRLKRFENGRLTLDLSEARSKKMKRKQQAAGEKIEIDFSNVEKANLVPEI